MTDETTPWAENESMRPIRSAARFAGQAGEFDGQCAAVTRNGTRCLRRAVRGRAVCDRHGGKSPSGIASPAFKTGQHVRAGRYTVPAAMQAQYERFLDDRDALIEAADEMALIGARIASILNEISTEAGGNGTGDFFRAWDALVVALAGKNPTRIRECIAACDQFVERMRGSESRWAEIYGLLDLLRKQRTTEVQRVKVEKEYANVHQMRTFLAASQNVILTVCALAPTKELEWEMRDTYANEMRRVLALPIVGG